MLKLIAGLCRKAIGAASAEHVVFKDTCEVAKDGVHQRFDDLKIHIDQRFDMLVLFMKKNGNGK